MLNPGAIDFGAVLRGQSPSQVLTIDRINLEGWRVHRMVSGSRVLNAQLVETSRKGGAVSYTLTVSLKPDAPAGPIRDEIRILSNDPETPSIPVMVTAWIRGELTAAPSVLSMGQVQSAAGVQGRFVIRGAHPFTIRAIEGNGDGFSASAAPKARQAVHVVTVAYKPEEGTTRGDLRRVFRVHTDLPGEPPAGPDRHPARRPLTATARPAMGDIRAGCGYNSTARDARRTFLSGTRAGRLSEPDPGEPSCTVTRQH